MHCKIGCDKHIRSQIISALRWCDLCRDILKCSNVVSKIHCGKHTLSSILLSLSANESTRFIPGTYSGRNTDNPKSVSKYLLMKYFASNQKISLFAFMVVEKVSRFDILMNHPIRMQMFERNKQLTNIFIDLITGHYVHYSLNEKLEQISKFTLNIKNDQTRNDVCSINGMTTNTSISSRNAANAPITLFFPLKRNV